MFTALSRIKLSNTLVGTCGPSGGGWFVDEAVHKTQYKLKNKYRQKI